MEFVLVEKSNKIGTITINRVKALNALNDQVLGELSHVMNSLEKDEEVKVIIVTGAGDKAFIAGADIVSMQGKTPRESRQISHNGHSVFSLFENSPKPVIAAVNGFALGGGCELALACDFRIASMRAKFGLPEINLGIIPGWGGTQRLTRLVGEAKAKEMILLGNPIDANEALRIGLVIKVVPADALLEEANDLARTLAERSSVALQMAKAAINFGIKADLSNGLRYEAECLGLCFASEDSQEGLQAFTEKRKPVFLDR